MFEDEIDDTDSSEEAKADEEEEIRHAIASDNESRFMESMEMIGVGNVWEKFKYEDVSEMVAQQENGELQFDDPEYHLFTDHVEEEYHPYHVYQGDPGMLPRPTEQRVTVFLDDDTDDGHD